MRSPPPLPSPRERQRADSFPHADAIFRFNCFNVEDSHDPDVGLEFGELAIPGRVLKTEVFDPVIGASPCLSL